MQAAARVVRKEDQRTSHNCLLSASDVHNRSDGPVGPRSPLPSRIDASGRDPEASPSIPGGETEAGGNHTSCSRLHAVGLKQKLGFPNSQPHAGARAAGHTNGNAPANPQGRRGPTLGKGCTRGPPAAEGASASTGHGTEVAHGPRGLPRRL